MLSGYNDWRKTGGIVFDGPITVVSDLPALALVDGGGRTSSGYIQHGTGH